MSLKLVREKQLNALVDLPLWMCHLLVDLSGSWGMFSWVATIQYLTMAIRELGLLKLPNLLFQQLSNKLLQIGLNWQCQVERSDFKKDLSFPLNQVESYKAMSDKE
ncbi:hypothetical protein CMV_017912 [Castanea mollissima]|uniref:Uncharacterized protein n=1 Tax=Castanea mollissima TaxID=60419 RepID=A0A8J4R5F2_9ROSI|nr:hypothetical protein CMV_017912 [Castanea mollissima]